MSKNGKNNKGGRPKIDDNRSSSVSISSTSHKMLQFACGFEGGSIKGLIDIAVINFLQTKEYYEYVKTMTDVALNQYDNEAPVMSDQSNERIIVQNAV